MKRYLVFTDLDGSLLDHHDYNWQKATPALELLENMQIPVIINSSKTAAEIQKLRHQLNNHHPYIAENGAISYLPDELLEPEKTDLTWQPHYFATPYKEIIGTLENIRNQHAFSFRGFFDMEPEEIASICDLDIENARDAKSRDASEPLLWQDSDESLIRFEFLLHEQGLIIVKGGRFYHVNSEVDKGNTLLWITERYQEAQPDTQWITIGLGDSYNDVAMLEVVDYPVLIKNPVIKQPNLNRLTNLYVSTHSGPAGWNEAINKLLEEKLIGAAQ